MAAGKAVVADEDRGQSSFGVIIGATGIGEAITANKVKGVRAVLGSNPASLQEARSHFDANVLTLGARTHTPAEALSLIENFVAEKFQFDEPDVRRLLHTAEFENSGTIEGWMIDTTTGSAQA